MKFPRCMTSFLAVLLCVAVDLAPHAWGADSNASALTDDQVAPTSQPATVAIPGPLRSFLRMAGISQKISPDEVLPLLSRNVFLLGYEGSQTRVRPTEFLILLSRYVQQARELNALAGPEGVIRVSSCEQARPLLQVLGYRTRTDCGQRGTYLETADAQRAFLTIDSGFPLPDLERTLQGGQPFAYDFHGARVPMLFSESDWSNGKPVIDAIIRDPAVARLYWAMSRVDPETQAILEQSPGLKKLAPVAPDLDFYGSHI